MEPVVDFHSGSTIYRNQLIKVIILRFLLLTFMSFKCEVWIWCLVYIGIWAPRKEGLWLLINAQVICLSFNKELEIFLFKIVSGEVVLLALMHLNVFFSVDLGPIVVFGSQVEVNKLLHTINSQVIAPLGARNLEEQGVQHFKIELFRGDFIFGRHNLFHCQIIWRLIIY